MSDEKQNLGEMKKALSKLEGAPFVNFAKPYLDFIEKGKLFAIFYMIMAVINLLIPFIVLYKTIDSGLFAFGAKVVFTIIFSWIVIAFACWIGFQLWWNRKARVEPLEDSEFVVTPIFSEILKTFGEWLGTLIGIIGAGMGLIATLMLGDDASYLFRMIGMGFMPSGIIAVAAGPLIGFIIMLLFRLVAEQMRLLVALANNTKCIAANIKESQ